MGRYLIIGASGSGKSTLAKKLSVLSSISYYDTDALYWQPNWSLQSDELALSKLPLDEPNWILDGNFVGLRHIVWNAADCIVWLCPPPHIVLSRIIKRNLSWWWSRQPIWSGNIMSLKLALSGVMHTVSQLFRHPREYPHYLQEFAGKKIYLIRNEYDSDVFLKSCI